MCMILSTMMTWMAIIIIIIYCINQMLSTFAHEIVFALLFLRKNTVILVFYSAKVQASWNV